MKQGHIVRQAEAGMTLLKRAALLYAFLAIWLSAIIFGAYRYMSYGEISPEPGKPAEATATRSPQTGSGVVSDPAQNR
jgi:hypothetical protein